MFLQQLTLINFKNYQQVELEFSPKINCFIGNNGVGKTNLLDAIYYLSFCKSYFNTIDSQNIKYLEDFFMVQGIFERNGNTENIHCALKRNQKKQFKRNKKEYERLSEHIGLLPAVIISPFDYELITGGSDERRRFTNSVISQYDHPYLEALIKYNHALNQRNTLLKEIAKTGKFDRSLLEIWDDQLIARGNLIFDRRRIFMEQLLPIFSKYYSTIVTNGNESTLINLEYQSQLFSDTFENLLKQTLDKDLALQYTSTGIHKDDLVFTLNNYQLKKSGSQGQQKSFLIALKLAQFEIIKATNQVKPILLLDDIFDKLDESRVRQLVQIVSNNDFGQIFITDTHRDRIEKILEDITDNFKIFTIDNGTIVS